MMTLNVDVGGKMAFTEQSLPELADKETREKLALWDRSSEPMAPLTDKQMDSVLEIRSAAETLPIPAEVSVNELQMDRVSNRAVLYFIVCEKYLVVQSI